MKTKESVSSKKPTVALKELKTKRNPKGGTIAKAPVKLVNNISDQAAGGVLSSY